MTISAGSTLGPYEIVTPLGAGGMGEVWKAVDPRIGRDVAIKILHRAMSSNDELVRRFEQEARTAGQLNHPNLMAVHDVGKEGEIAYLVTELLEGETLRDRLSGGALPMQRAVEWAAGIASGMAAAHEKGIVHRDLKPENVFVTKDNRVKILDFGLARLTNVGVSDSGKTDAPTDHRTDPGKVMGTVGYMSPEQVRALPVDHRSDIFSFGCILYEMLTGVRAFRRDSSIETMNAILKEEPPELSASNPNLHPGLERIVRHCLEKHAEARFQSAKDLAFDLESLSATSGSMPSFAAASRGTRRLVPIAALAGVIALAAVAFFAGSRFSSRGATSLAEAPRLTGFQRISFRRGNVIHGRLTSDGKTAVYSAAWDGKPMEVFTTQLEDRIARPLGIERADVLAVSSKGEIALLLKKNLFLTTAGRGTLARVSLGGGVPRELLEDVLDADWSPDGEELAVIRYDPADSQLVLEYPIGTELIRKRSGLSSVIVSPDGNSVLFIEQESPGSQSLRLVGRDGKARTIKAAHGGGVLGGRARWVGEDRITLYDFQQSTHHLFDLEGNVEVLYESPGLEILDITAAGVALLEREVYRTSIYYGERDVPGERDLAWLDYSILPTLTGRGQLLFSEVGQGGGNDWAMFVRNVDGSPAVMLGEGVGIDISPDGKWVLSSTRSARDTLVVVPTGAGRRRAIKVAEMPTLFGGKFVPDGRSLVVAGLDPSGAPGFALYDLDSSKVTPLEPLPRTEGIAISPAGDRIVFAKSEGLTIRALEGGKGEALRGSESGDIPVNWSGDGKTIWAMSAQALPRQIYAIDVANGRRSLWKELAPSDLAGVVRIDEVSIARDGNSWAYTCVRVTASDLYTAKLTGLK